MHSFGSCISFFGCHTANVSNFKCYDRNCPAAETWERPCTDKGNGHMMTFYPPNFFGGHYKWSDTDSGMCHVTLKGWIWESLEDHHVIDYTRFDEPMYDGSLRDTISRCYCSCGKEESWGGYRDSNSGSWVIGSGSWGPKITLDDGKGRILGDYWAGELEGWGYGLTPGERRCDWLSGGKSSW